MQGCPGPSVLLQIKGLGESQHIGDRDGALRIPAAIAEDVIGKAEAAIATENKVRTAILGGQDPQQAYIKFGKF